ncbi:MAG: DeoR/GlpR family DNA-binding transcription regulator [Dongiaceae bacterium]
MQATQRQLEILELLRLQGSFRIGDLAHRLDVSEETIRRNVRLMAAQGLVRKVHGGVHLPELLHEPTFQQRMNEQRALKERIAGRVAAMIEDGDSLMLDIGSTTAYVAQALKNHRDLYIVTNSVAIAQILAPRNGNRVFLAGGELRAHDGGAFGVEAHAFVRQFGVRYAVLSVAAIDGETGFMLHDMQEAEFSRAIMERAEQVIVAADSTKFERRAPVRLIAADAVDYLITDAAPPRRIADLFGAAGVEIVLAGTSK